MEDVRTLIKKKMNLLDLQKMLVKRGELINSTVTATNAENQLGQALIDAGIEVTPQFEVQGLSFDFKTQHFPVIIEIDGGIHNEPEKRGRDYQKDRIAQRRGFKVLRFTNGEINNPQQCVEEIKLTMQYCGVQPKEVWLYPYTIPEQVKAWLKKAFKKVKK